MKMIIMRIHFALLVEALFKMSKAAAKRMNLLTFLISAKAKPITMMFGQTKTVGNGSKTTMTI